MDGMTYNGRCDGEIKHTQEIECRYLRTVILANYRDTLDIMAAQQLRLQPNFTFYCQKYFFESNLRREKSSIVVRTQNLFRFTYSEM